MASTNIDSTELNRAESLLIKSGASMTHDEIRSMLRSEGVKEPVVDYVLSKGSARQLKKVKSGTSIAWE